MPLPFDILAVMLFLGYYAESPDPNPPRPALSLAIMGAVCLIMLLVSALINRAALRTLRRPGYSANRRRALVYRAEMLLRVLLTALYGIGLVRSSFPWSMATALGLAKHPDSFGIQMFGLLPYVVLFFAAWLPMYRLHRETNFGQWTRRSFLVHKARYNLYILLAWIPFALLADWLNDFLAVLPLLFLTAAWAFPLVLARAWGCKRMPEGEVMAAVRRLEKSAGCRFSRVYLWEPGGGNIQNAAAVGILPPFHYLFLTPALIRTMSGPELDAVILHELGHIKKKHLLFYLFTSLAGLNLAALAGMALPMGTLGERFIVTALMLFIYFRVIFGWLSRNMERQADLFALEHSGSSRGLANALEKMGLAAGNIRLAASWHHLGIAERVDFLRGAERHPDLARRHNSGVAGIMAGGYVLSFLLLGGMAWLIYSEYTGLPARPAERAADAGEMAHWRRVMQLMPDDATAPLELAYRLAGVPSSREEAEALADQALRLAVGGEERAAAAKLLHELKEPQGGSLERGGVDL